MKINSDHIELDWQDIYQLVAVLSKEVLSSFQPDVLFTILRGGTLVGIIFSHQLNIREVDVLNIKRTDTESINSGKIIPQIVFGNQTKLKGKKVLLIDDIVGSGLSLRLAKDFINRQHPKALKTLSLVVNETNWGKNNPFSFRQEIDFIGKVVDRWVLFPWEVLKY